jgi:hypothetical protein
MKVMRLIRFLGFAAAATSSPCFASMCIDGNPSAAEEFKRSAFVVEASVAALKETNQAYSYKGKQYVDQVDDVSLLVQHAYKGSATSLHFANPRTSASMPLQVGRTYLLFLQERQPGNLYVDTCGPSGDLKDLKPGVLGAVKSLSQP